MMDDSFCKVLSEIDLFGSKQNRERLQFLTRAFASVDEQEKLAQDCTASAVFSLLCLKVSSAPKALPILQRMLKAARYDQERVSKLHSHTDHSSFSLSVTVSNLISKLSFYELLLIVSYKIDTCPKGRLVLKHMLEGISDKKISAPREDVKSALHLFTCMLTAGTLTSSKPDTVISELRELWCEASSKDELVKMVIEDIEDTVARNVVQGTKHNSCSNETSHKNYSTVIVSQASVFLLAHETIVQYVLSNSLPSLIVYLLVLVWTIT